jgi:NitT/TauT family transport system permease protein
VSWKPYAFVIGILVVVEITVLVFHVPQYLVPAPTQVFVELRDQRDYLMSNVPATFYEIWAGFLIALVVGIALAIPVALTKFGEQALMPILVATQSVPKSALAPIFVVWFGFGFTPKIVVAALLAFFPIVVNMVRGLRSVDPEMVQYLTTLGASKWEILRRLRIPTSAPYLLAAMKVSISLATVGAIVGEFVGADSGLGHVILKAINDFDTTTMFAALLVVSVIGVISYGVIALIEKRVLSWQLDDVAVASAGA